MSNDKDRQGSDTPTDKAPLPAIPERGKAEGQEGAQLGTGSPLSRDKLAPSSGQAGARKG